MSTTYGNMAAAANNKSAVNNNSISTKSLKSTNDSFNSVLNKTIYLKEPDRSGYKSREEFYEADNEYIKKLLENPNALPDTGIEGYKLTKPTEGVSRSTDVYGRKIEDSMLKFLGKDGQVVWQVFVPNLHWHKTKGGRQDPEVGDAYSRNLSRYAAKTVLKRGDEIGEKKTLLDGVIYDGGQAYRQFQRQLYSEYNKMYASYYQERLLAELDKTV
ncbi:hypothetical protein JOC37_000068 [Desulfohalotomaculum tongense]|uniref:hypothetical protein n=1 Tax=Desulforadius tongensis TaxID=1216062 RepID=UPI00195767B2|nr:hypothetical protein [Desulforadius tongensis]MBM7853703.1 hypothetical protein [Desulforadius tongensis]